MIATAVSMNFYEALQQVAQGARVTKSEWGNPAVFMCLFHGQLCIRKTDAQYHPLIISDGDLAGTDYVISEHPTPEDKFRSN